MNSLLKQAVIARIAKKYAGRLKIVKKVPVDLALKGTLLEGTKLPAKLEGLHVTPGPGLPAYLKQLMKS